MRGRGRLRGPWPASILRPVLWWWTRPGRVDRVVGALGIRRSANLRHLDPAAIRVAAVQLEIRPCRDPGEFVRWVAEPLGAAVAAGAQLVVFPEDVGMALLGVLPGFERWGSGSPEEALDHLGARRVADVLALVGPALRRVHHATFSALARAHGVLVHAGSVMVPQGAGVYNVGFLYGPDGRLLARQAKAHLLPLEAHWGLCPGATLPVVPTPLGPMGLAVCMDATYFETFRLLALQGAEIVLVPIANPEPYNLWHARRGTWARVQETPVYGVVAALVGRFLGMELTGRVAVYAPLALTPRGDGVLAEARRWDRPEVVHARLDLLRLRQYRRQVGFPRYLRADLYQRYLEPAYHRLLARSPAAPRPDSRPLPRPARPPARG